MGARLRRYNILSTETHASRLSRGRAPTHVVASRIEPIGAY
ncbi:hypothetical protein HMPREF1155_1650 [Slackia sp. CM382]|nr:hypothetical protein HMPREF1155_1650 [Slackia sp. CM382]